MPSADIVGIDAGAVGRSFAAPGVDFAGTLACERIGGQSNPTYRLPDQDSRRRTLRRPPLGHLPAPAHDVAREARIPTALESTAAPTPRAPGLTDGPAVTDVPLARMAVREAAEVGVSDPYRGEPGAAFVSLRPEEPVEPEKLVAHCREQLATHKAPGAVSIRADVPKSTCGKILRQDLRGATSA